MGLFSSWGNMLSPAPTQDTSAPTVNPLLNYNDNVAQQKIDRSKAIAAALQKQALEKQGAGTFFKSGDFTGYAGGPTLGSALMQGLSGLAAHAAGDRTSEAIQKQGQDQIDAMSLRLGIMDGRLDKDGNPVTTPEMVKQADDKLFPPSDEVSVGGANPQGSVQQSDLALPPTGAGAGRGSISPDAKKRAAELLALPAEPVVGAGGGRGGQGGPTAEQANPGGVDAGYLPGEGVMAHVVRNAKKIGALLNGEVFGTNVQPAQVDTRPDQQVITGSPVQTGGATGSWAPTPPQAPVQNRPMPTAVQMQAPMPNPTAPVVPVAQPAPQPVAAPVAKDGGPMFQAATNAPQQAPQQSTAQTLDNLARLALTGPQGQAIASAVQAQMFANKNGRYKTEVHSDPINGGFVLVNTDTVTGDTKIQQLGNGGNTKIVGETTDAQGNRFNRHADGSVTPMMNGNQPLQDHTVTEKRNAIQSEAEVAKSQLDDVGKTLDELTGINPSTGKPIIDAAAGPSGALSNWISGKTGIHTNSGEVNTKLDGVQSKLRMAGMAMFKAAGAGSSSFNSDAEGAALEHMLGSLDVGKLGTEGFIRKANEIKMWIADRTAQIEKTRDLKLGNAPQMRTPGAAPVKLNLNQFRTGGQ